MKKIKCLVQSYEDNFKNEEVSTADVVLVPVEHEGVKSFFMIKNRAGDILQVVEQSQLGAKLFEMSLEN